MKKSKVAKFIASISSACMIASSISAASVSAAEVDIAVAPEVKKTYDYGDANLDGFVNMADAVLVLQSIANGDEYGIGKPDGITEAGADLADVEERGNGLTTLDALAIQEFSMDIVKELPVSYKQTTSETTTSSITTTTSSTSTASTTSTTTTTAPVVDPKSDITYIHLKGTTITVEGDNAAAEDNKVTITHSGEYYIDGTLDDGQICVNIADETADPDTVKIFLNGVNITGKSAPAILITNAENTSINLLDGTENFISDGDTAYVDATGAPTGEAVIEAKDDITIKGGTEGTGILNVTANTQDGIFCKNDIKINGGNVNVKTLNSTDKTDAVKGKKSVTVKSGNVTVEAEGDGIKSSKGAVAVSGGSVIIKAGNDAVQAETTIDISGGTVFAGGDRGLTAVTGINITGGTVYATATDNQVDEKLLSGTTQTTALLNCIDDASSKDGTWKKANVIAANGNKKIQFTKKYKYVLVSDNSINGAKSCSFVNLSTSAAVTHTDGKQTQFNLGLVNVFENVDPSGASTVDPTVDPTTDDLTITLSGATISTNAPADTASVENGVLTIKKPAVFSVSGSGEGTQIVVDVDKTAYPDSVVELDLKGMSLTNTNTAPIYVASIGDEVQIVAKAGTENTISDGTSHTQTYTDSDGNTNTVEGAIFARDDIKFKGTGTLTVNGNQDDAIVCKNDIKIYNGNLIVNAIDDSIRGKDSVTIGNDSKSDGTAVDYSNLKVTVNTTGSGDGIKSTATDTSADKSYGIVTINGGTVNIKSYADGIQAEQEFIMNGGDVTISTYQGSSYTGNGTSTGQTNPWGGFGGGGFGGPGGQGGDGNSNKTDISAKGIKAVGLYNADGTTWSSKGNITINGGTLNIDSSDDCIHCGGDMYLYGGAFTLASADDGAHSDHSLTIGKSKADVYDDITIQVTKAYEGIEGMNITQNSGSVIVTSTDDSFNAAGGADGSGNQFGGRPGPGQQWGQGSMGSGSYLMTFNGGLAVANVSNGDHDGFDSNGDIKLNGGIQISNGSEPFDCGDSGNTISVNGSTWINYYSSTMGDSLRNSATVTGSSSANTGTRISLVNKDNSVVVSFICGQKSASNFYAGGANTSGTSFAIGGTVTGGNELITGNSNGVIVGGTLSNGKVL